MALIRRLLVLLPVLLTLFCATARPYRFTNYTQNQQAMRSILQQRVAVMPMSGPEGRRFAEEFAIQLGRLNRFMLVERSRIEDLYAEQDLDPDRIDQSTAVRLGKMLGAHAVVMGTVNDYRPGRVSANVRLVAVETGAIAWQGADALNGSDPRVQALVTEREDRERLRTQPDYLARWLCQLLAESIQ